MAVTPQTNTTLRAIADELARRDDFVICGHVSPDGDCLGSQLALMHALRSLGKHVTCVLAEDDGCVDEAFSFMPGLDGIVSPSAFDGSIGVFIGVDVPTVARIGDAAALHAKAPFKVTIDHHAVESTMADLVYVDPDAAATAQLIWELAGHLAERRDAAIATCAYTGLVTDTGRFQYQNTDAASLVAASEMVAAGADPALVAREVFQNRRLASIQLESRAIERMVFTDDGAAVASWLLNRRLRGARRLQARRRADHQQPPLRQGRPRRLRAARAGPGRARQPPRQGRHGRERVRPTLRRGRAQGGCRLHARDGAWRGGPNGPRRDGRPRVRRGRGRRAAVKRGSTDYCLVVGIDKPAGMSSLMTWSTACCVFGERRVGHTGTLDPMAEGVLPVCGARDPA